MRRVGKPLISWRVTVWLALLIVVVVMTYMEFAVLSPVSYLSEVIFEPLLVLCIPIVLAVGVSTIKHQRNKAITWVSKGNRGKLHRLDKQLIKTFLVAEVLSFISASGFTTLEMDIPMVKFFATFIGCISIIAFVITLMIWYQIDIVERTSKMATVKQKTK